MKLCCTLYTWNQETVRTLASHRQPKSSKKPFQSKKSWHHFFGTTKASYWLNIYLRGDHQRSKVLWNPKKLRTAIQNKRRGMLTRGVCLLHDNARPHVANEAIFGLIWMGFFEPPSIFLDLMPSDYHLFTSLKKHMGVNNFLLTRRRRSGREVNKGGADSIDMFHEKNSCNHSFKRTKSLWSCYKIEK